MVQKADDQAKQMAGARQDKAKVYVDETYFRHVDQLERWRQEYERYQAVENKLADISKLAYEEVDYTPLLERAIFQERVIPDFSYMVENAKVAAEDKFVRPIAIHVILVVIFMFVLIIGSDSILLWVSGAGVVTVLILLGLMIQNRYTYIQKVIEQKQKEVEARIVYEHKKIEEERKKHEESEDERIRIVERLLEGEIGSIFAKIENVFSKINFSFYLTATVELYHNIPLVTVWLPPKSIIPTQICTRQSSGRPSFKDKDMRAINKQYLELCAATVMNIISVLYSHIPTFDIGYVHGMSKEGKEIECLLASKLDRETLAMACSAANGLEAVQKAKVNFQCDTLLELLPVEHERPEEWGEIGKEFVRSLHLNLFRT